MGGGGDGINSGGDRGGIVSGGGSIPQALAVAGAFFWGELVAMELAAAAAVPTTGEAVSPAKGEVATGAATAATALEDAWWWDAWRRVVMPTAPAIGDAAAALAADTVSSSVGGGLGNAPARCAGGGGGSTTAPRSLLTALPFVAGHS